MRIYILSLILICSFTSPARADIPCQNNVSTNVVEDDIIDLFTDDDGINNSTSDDITLDLCNDLAYTRAVEYKPSALTQIAYRTATQTIVKLLALKRFVTSYFSTLYARARTTLNQLLDGLNT